ncbi:hypothetical protein HOD29_01855 [archaeon]|jgi:hypothetical protein|nr:hypothetical protein [archaeon]
MKKSERFYVVPNQEGDNLFFSRREKAYRVAIESQQENFYKISIWEKKKKSLMFKDGLKALESSLIGDLLYFVNKSSAKVEMEIHQGYFERT